MNKILICVGARPNLMKASSLFRASKFFPKLQMDLLHTGQHYSTEMDRVFFDQLRIPQPNYQLNVGSGTHAVQTADVMKKFETVLAKRKYQLVVVIGDINSTVACSLVAKKLNIKVAHVESGLRSFDMTMPEEINRKIVDQISDYLFTTEPSANKNLLREGVSKKQIFFVGNTMIDTLVQNLDRIRTKEFIRQHHLMADNYAVLTLHRPTNVDDRIHLMKMLGSIASNTPADQKIVFPIHPRTRKMLGNRIHRLPKKFTIVAAQPYFSFMSLVYHSKYVLTDSGGIQEETTFLKKPCFTLRENTERPITIEIGSNFLIGKNLKSIRKKLRTFNVQKVKKPKFWDGRTGYRILSLISKF